MSVAPTAKNYFSEFLQGLGLPVTQANLNALYGVAQLEGWNNRYNPLNVIQPMPGSTSYNSVGVQSYADFDSGVKGAVILFGGSHWAGVRRALAQGNSAQGVLAAFKAAYTWDPGVQFPMGQPSWGGKTIGSNAGSGKPVSVAGGGTGGGGGGEGVSATRAELSGVDSLGSLLDKIPELSHLVDEALNAKHPWSLEKFQNEVEDSHWWKNHSSTARQVLVEKANDPASWDQDLRNARNSVNNLAHQLGFTLNANQIDNIATSALMSGNGSNQQWLTQQVGRRQDYSHLGNLGGLQGGMAATTQQLSKLAGDYGFKWDPSQTAQHAQQILMGNQTIDTYKQRLESWAISAFPSLAKQIQAGSTVKELADPYVQSMSQLLELNPGSIDLYNPTVRKALQGTPQKDGQLAQTPLWAFENQLRGDPRWQYTDNAHQAVSSLALQIGSAFGFDG